MIGIYKIVNKINNKVYIGSATDIKKRWRDHKWYLNHNIHHNSYLQSSWNKYGKESFDFLLILLCEIDELLILEKDNIIKYNAFDNKYGYNVNDPEHSFLNRKHTEETKQKLSFQKLGSKNPMFGKIGDKHHNFNLKMSDEQKSKITASKLGVPTNNRNYTKLKPEDVINIHKLYTEGNITQLELSKIYNVTDSTICMIIKRKRWATLF